MKNNKNGQATKCCWGYRHELLGLILLVLATILTIITCNSFGIVAMFLVGLVLCCYRYMCCYCCHTHAHCHVSEEECSVLALEKEEKPQVKKSATKAKTKV